MIKVDARRARRKIELVKAEVLRRSAKTVGDLMLAGFHHARGIVPVWTGETQRKISTEFMYESDGPVARIKAQNIIRPGFDLVRWMSASNGILEGEEHIRSGDPRFMLSTKKWLNERKLKVAKGNFQTLNIK